MRFLLHTCCANCLADVLDAWKAEGLEPAVYFANPNIHPLIEWRRRRKSVVLFAQRLGLEYHEEPYGLVSFLRAVVGREDERCRTCYAMRLSSAAAKSKELGLESFSTTLLSSPQQNSSLIAEAGEAAEAAEAAARAEGVEFLHRDHTHLHDRGVAPPGLRLYRQQYCGCVYSEFDRFSSTSLQLLEEERCAPRP